MKFPNIQGPLTDPQVHEIIFAVACLIDDFFELRLNLLVLEHGTFRHNLHIESC